MTEHLQNLLKEGINDEALRRMSRRAGVQATSQKDSDHVNNALRAIGEQILANLCEKLAIYVQYRAAKTVSKGDVRAACDVLRIKLAAYAVPSNENSTFEKCRKFSPGERETKRTRGELAERETKHEQKRENCVYNETAPFVRLVRNIMSDFDASLLFTPATLSWIQYIMEQLLITLLQTAGRIVKDTTLPPKGGASRATLSYRDLAAALDTLSAFSCVPVFEGCAELAREAGKADGGSGDSGDKRAVGSKPKAAAKAKAASGRGASHAKGTSKSSGRGSAKSKTKAESSGKGSGRGRAKSRGRGAGRGRGKSIAEDPVRELQSLYAVDKEKAKDKGSFAAKYSKDKSVF